MSNLSREKSTLTKKVSPLAEIRKCSVSGNHSLYALTNLIKGQILSKFDSKEKLCKPNYLTVQISDGKHIMLEPEWLQYINHSCEPNVFFDTLKQEVIVLSKIESGEEITFFYPSTEWSMDNAFDCLCGSQKCLKRIFGAAYLPSQILMNYKLSNFIQNKITGDKPSNP